MPISDYNKNAQGTQVVRSVQRPPEKRSWALNTWIKNLCAERKSRLSRLFCGKMADEKGFLKAEDCQ